MFTVFINLSGLDSILLIDDGYSFMKKYICINQHRTQDFLKGFQSNVKTQFIQ